MNIHDSGYKRLFSNRTIFRQLVQTFVEEDWVDRLDFARAERVEKSFVSEHYKETEADIIYKVPLKTAEMVAAQAVYFYWLIEFQSAVDRFMAARVGHYLLSFWLDYRQTTARVKSLPQVFPIVLYNGSELWTAPTVFRDLLEQTLDLGEYSVEVRYFPIIVNAYPLAQLLAEANAVTTLFVTEAHYDPIVVIERLLALYDQEDPEAASLLANWFLQMSIHKRIPPEDYRLLERQYRSKEELRTMLVESLIKREREAEAKAKAEGKAEGKEERNRQVARAMAANGYAHAEIMRLLAMNEEELLRLLAETDSQQ